MTITIDEIIREVKSKAAGRTRYDGQEPRWDEMMVEKIERLRAEIAELNAVLVVARKFAERQAGADELKRMLALIDAALSGDAHER